MNTIGIAAATVIGARHARDGRNGQDAAVAWVGDGAAAIVVCDGCSAGTSSEVGARLGASLFVRALAARIAAGARIAYEDTWTAVRADVARALAGVIERMHGDRTQVIHDCFLFTIVAAAARGDEAAVWALGDGAYAIDHRTTLLGPFADNQPPYLAYDLLGDPRDAHFEVASSWTSLAIATDGAIDAGLERFVEPRFVAHPDALRRELVVLARPATRIAWDERRIARTPALLQDDCAIALLYREAA